MPKVKLSKGELKRQRDSLKQFQHYLPTLLLKKQQLQMKILEARAALRTKEAELERQREAIDRWVGLLADPMLPPGMNLKTWLVPDPGGIVLDTVNIAGARVPVLKTVNFPEAEYDLFLTPLWVDRGIADLRDYLRGVIETGIVRRQVAILRKELRVTTQRVNLFEKVKIPECQNNIRLIRIYLGDQQANAVGISKVAKKKLEAAAAV
jgi:V/A-type H+-transporting ATPase subunit D